MDFLTKLERKYGKFAIPNLTFLLIAGFIVGYLIMLMAPEALGILALDPSKVMQGQVYRLLTWVLIPPSDLNIFVFIMLIFYFSIGRTLENTLGDFQYTVYIISGIVFTDIGMMLTYFIMKLAGQASLLELFYQYGYFGASTYYLCMTMFLAYAFLFPDLQVLIYFIIPVRVKWMGYLDIIYLIITIYQYGRMRYYAGMVTVIMSVLNFIIFYFLLKGKKTSRAHRKRKKQYKKEVRNTQILTRHKCAICGRTEEDDPNLDFRYCSRCKGNYEYCQNHLFTHEHKK